MEIILSPIFEKLLCFSQFEKDKQCQVQGKILKMSMHFPVNQITLVVTFYELSFIHDQHLYSNVSSFQVKNIFNHGFLMVNTIYTTSGNHIKGESNFHIKNQRYVSLKNYFYDI